MNNIQKDIAEHNAAMQKRQAEMQLLVNALEQELNPDLCEQVARVIDITAETAELTDELLKIRSRVPWVQQRLKTLIGDSASDCQILKSGVLKNIANYAAQGQVNEPAEYANKIGETIDYCTSNYAAYQKTDYYQQYGGKSYQSMGKLSRLTIGTASQIKTTEK